MSLRCWLPLLLKTHLKRYAKANGLKVGDATMQEVIGANEVEGIGVRSEKVTVGGHASVPKLRNARGVGER